MHCPAATVPTHELGPLETVTLPVGVPPPGEFTVTAYWIVNDCPVTDGSGLSLVIAVVVEAGATVCVAPADDDAEKVASPA